jgi:hypothetical protein
MSLVRLACWDPFPLGVKLDMVVIACCMLPLDNDGSGNNNKSAEETKMNCGFQI